MEPIMANITLVTGASRGLGRATALAVAQRGGDVIATYRGNAEDARTLVAEIESLGRKAVALQLDTADVGGFPDFVARVRQALHDTWQRDRSEHLVNYAGHGVHATIHATNAEQAHRLRAPP